jgi:hypothetical protein
LLAHCYSTFLLNFSTPDRCARELLASDATVRRAVSEAFGEDILDESGDFDRARLRALVFADESQRRKLETILHPRFVAAGVIKQRPAPAPAAGFASIFRYFLKPTPNRSSIG